MIYENTNSISVQMKVDNYMILTSINIVNNIYIYIYLNVLFVLHFSYNFSYIIIE